MLAGIVPTSRSEPGKRFYQLTAGDAARTIHLFINQSGAQVFYLVPKVKGVTTNSVHGEFTAHEAIERMTADTVLTVVHDKKTGAFTIKRADRPGQADKNSSAQARSLTSHAM